MGVRDSDYSVQRRRRRHGVQAEVVLMASYSICNPRNGRLAVPVPHTITISVPRDEDADAILRKEMYRWVRSGERLGHYRVDELKFRYRFHFSDENTALEFKLRFG
jgi:hypothetical protein